MAKGAAYSTWYEANKEIRNEKRSRRYHTDPIYRQAVIEKARKLKKARKIKPVRVPNLDKASYKKSLLAPSWSTEEIEIDGVMVKVFTIGAVAKVFGKSVSTLRVWESNGVLPPPPHRDYRGRRYYPFEMIMGLRAKLVAEGRLNPVVNKKQEKPTYVDRKVRFADGRVETLRLMTVGVLAKALQKKWRTIMGLETTGYIPKTHLITGRQFRAYTPEMIEVVKKVLDSVGYPAMGFGHGVKIRPELTRGRIMDGWKALGVLGAEVVEDGDETENSDSGGREDVSG